jgi:hypothetical protein
LNALLLKKWGEPGASLDVYEFTKTSRRTFATARAAGEMTEQRFIKIAVKAGYDDYREFLRDLGPKGRIVRPTTPIPTSLSLSTQKTNLQWADFRDYFVPVPRPWVLRCRITTRSPYFRFGFKLLGESGRIFGDGLIHSHDENLLVHIGRNHFNRPALKLAAGDVFVTAYVSGIATEDDRFLFRSSKTISIPVELRVDRNYYAALVVDGTECFTRVVSPSICGRVAVYAWGDREEFQVDVTGMALESI